MQAWGVWRSGAESVVQAQGVDQPDTERDFSHFSPRSKKVECQAVAAISMCIFIFFFQWKGQRLRQLARCLWSSRAVRRGECNYAARAI